MSVCLLKLGLGTSFDMIAAFVDFLMSLCVKEKVFLLFDLGKVSKKKKKKVRNFPHFSGVGGFEKVIFRKKKYGLKMHKIT